jgi:general secretion pathway protein A
LLAAGGEEPRAWRQLAGLWGATLPAGVEPCSAAPAQGLRCYRSRGGLLLLRQLARPAIVRLVDEQGRSASVLLVGLDGQRAWLRSGGIDQALPLAQLARAWRGEFATLWRSPPGYREAEGSEAAAALGPWLARQIGIAEGAGAAASVPAAGAELRDRLYAFQLAQGLQPDGLAGPLTLMQLNRASGVDEPRLAARP